MTQVLDERGRLDGLRVLLVEDNRSVAEVICEALGEQGCEIEGPAASLSEGLVLARDCAFDGALLDVNLKGGYSFPIAELLIARHVPVLFMTGYTDEATIPPHLRTLGRIDKPIHFHKLFSVMGQLFSPTAEMRARG